MVEKKNKKKIKNIKYYIFLTIAAMSWWTVWVLIKKIWNNVPFMTVSFFRVFIWVLFLLPIIFFMDKKTLKFDIKNKHFYNYMIIWSLLAISTTLYNLANTLAPVQNVVIIWSSSAFFVIIFAIFLLKAKIKSYEIITIIIWIIWLIIINPFETWYALWWGLTLLSATVYALLIVKMKKEELQHHIWTVFWYLFFASIVLSPAPFIFWLWNINESYIFLILVWAIWTWASYLFFNLSMEKIKAEVSSIFTMIFVPIFSILFAVIFLWETIEYKVLIWWVILFLWWVYLNLQPKIKFFDKIINNIEKKLWIIKK